MEGHGSPGCATSHLPHPLPHLLAFYLAGVARTHPWKPEKAILSLEVELQATVSCHVSVRYREPLSSATPASAFAKPSPQLPHEVF